MSHFRGSLVNIFVAINNVVGCMPMVSISKGALLFFRKRYMYFYSTELQGVP